MDLVIRRFSAWSTTGDETEIVSDEDWKTWAASPAALGREGKPPVAFLPPAVRRRATRLTRLMVETAFACTTDEERGSVRTVFSSRHGAIHVAIKILASIAKEEAVSPLQFSHSVHNAQAGLFSIASGNREASSSVAGGTDTFAHGFLEAVLHLERRPEQAVLLVTGDEPVPDNVAHLVHEPEAAYATALLIARDGPGTRLHFSLDPKGANAQPCAWPDAVEFIRFLHAGDDALSIGRGRSQWRWVRATA